MMKKSFLTLAVASFLIALGAKAQTNLQVLYDFEREHVTTTLEMFKGDKWGNTFFFVDYDYNARNSDDKVVAPSGTYFEIARCLNFWQDTQLAPLSFQVEYNGGAYIGYPIYNAWLLGVDYFIHNSNFSNTLNLKALYKNIAETDSDVPMQLTAVWGCANIFGIKGLSFSGFADFWWEDHFCIDEDNKPSTESTIFIAEPQLWYNVGSLFGCENLNVGGEIELSNNFATAKGFKCRPCLGVKWNF